MASSILAWLSIAKNLGSNFCIPVVGAATAGGAEPGSASVEIVAIAKVERVEIHNVLVKAGNWKILEPNGNVIERRVPHDTPMHVTDTSEATEATTLDFTQVKLNQAQTSKVRGQLPGVHTKLHSFLRSNCSLLNPS